MAIYDAVVVGAGFSGLYLIKRLRDAGFSVCVVEAAPSVGGTWYWNAYPGARCDVESFDYCYSFSRELEEEWDWSERYPSQPELLRYLNYVADRFDLRREIRFETRVTAAAFDEARNLWDVSLDSGERIEGRFFILAGGAISVPKPPEIDGIESFRGACYHTGNWPQEGVDFSGQRVAVIGTGSSGVQTSTAIVDAVSQLTVFQRTPNYTAPMINYALDAAAMNEFRRTSPARHEKSRHSRQGIPYDLPTQSALSVSAEERAETFRNAWENSHLFALRLTYSDILTDEAANEAVSEFVRGKIREIVNDPAVAEKLTPRSYPFATKRPCLGRGYYEMFNRDHVRLVDLRETPIQRMTPAGIETSEGELAFDAVIFATGFDALTGAAARIDITGRGGVTLREKWADGPETYLGLASTGFPNLFFVTGPGSPGPLSAMVKSIEQHVDWIADCMIYLRDREIASIEADRIYEREWVEHVQSVALGTLYPRADSWYLGANVPGKPRKFMPYLGGVGFYRSTCDKITKAGYEGFELSRA
ncbi:NAD(P)/FAD-dependent oxidoreductase [Novosphingobium sp. G106]|uniref:flavin-containing monooxygenase n=1 Tax=Novosphingobium sp. G106 TaxID=2849500 RepID=UPI001C2D6BDE|nr:NAD(P)/FAD-dependent oxidoreductase [Novosphingobium sp. G106]MBV1688234.1 NAD(P)/FAD-dependent oxidoreductase [Novosphingobium sp. G106]